MLDTFFTIKRFNLSFLMIRYQPKAGIITVGLGYARSGTVPDQKQETEYKGEKL